MPELKRRSSTMNDEQRLIEKLQSIERLHAAATTPGEKEASANALERMRQRLVELSAGDPPVEHRFSLGDPWSRRLFLALLRRYDITPYRYPRQRYTTVMARIPRRFLNETLWPEFEQLNETLVGFLDDVTTRVVAEGVHADSSEASVVTEPGPVLPASDS